MKKLVIALAAVAALTGSALAQSTGNSANVRGPNYLERLLGIDRVTTSSVNRPQRNTNRTRKGNFSSSYSGNGLHGNYSGNVLERDVFTGR